MSADIERYIKTLCDTIIFARLNYDIWRVYTSPASRPTYLQTMNRYRLFFQTSRTAHLGALVVLLYRLYETSPRHPTLNIPKLLKMAEEQKAVDNATLESLKQIYANEAKPLWTKAGILRNEWFAHLSVERSVDEIFDKAKVTPNELRKLIEVSERLLNKLTQARNRETHAFNVDAHDDTVWLLKDLQYAREKRKAEEEELRKQGDDKWDG